MRNLKEGAKFRESIKTAGLSAGVRSGRAGVFCHAAWQRYAEIIHNVNVITIVKKRMVSETSGSLSLASVVQWSEYGNNAL